MRSNNRTLNRFSAFPYTEGLRQPSAMAKKLLDSNFDHNVSPTFTHCLHLLSTAAFNRFLMFGKPQPGLNGGLKLRNVANGLDGFRLISSFALG